MKIHSFNLKSYIRETPFDYFDVVSVGFKMSVASLQRALHRFGQEKKTQFS